MKAVNRAAAVIEDELGAKDDEDAVAGLESFAGSIAVEKVVDQAIGRLVDEFTGLIVNVAGAAVTAFNDPSVHDAGMNGGSANGVGEMDLKTARAMLATVFARAHKMLGFFLGIVVAIFPTDAGNHGGLVIRMQM